MGILDALLMEAFCSIHMSVFVLYPIAKIKHEEESKKYFLRYFLLRAIILIIGNFINTNICAVDFFMIFIGVMVILPITAKKYNKLDRIFLSHKSTNSQSTINLNNENVTSQVTEEIPTDIPDLAEIYPDYQAEEDSNNPNSIFNKMHINVDALLEEYVGLSIDNNDDINEENIKQIRMARIILSLITFLNISYICVYHRNFIVCFIIQIVTVIIYRNSIKKMNLLNFIKKQIMARPNDNMDYIIASARQNVLSKKSLGSRFIFPITLAICCVIFLKPHIIYEQKDDGYAVRYYTLAIFNNSNVKIPDEYNGKKVLEIRGNTFSNLNSLKTISLPKYITEIRGNTFENSGIEEIVIPEGVTRIGGHAFYGCDDLKSVTLPDTLKEIGSSAFRQCDSLYVIRIPLNVSVNEKAFKESPTRIERYRIDE